MATIRLIPSTYYLSNSSYLSVADAANMYSNTDDDSYATVTNSRTSTSSYYIYLRGFNFDAIPSDAIINSFTIKLKARESGVSTSDSYKPYLANGTSAINGSCDAITTTVDTKTFTGISADWDTIKGYGADFGIRINCRRASRNTTGYMYIYGAEIEVDYTMPVYHTVTSSTDSGTIDPSGAKSVLEGDTYTLKIYANNPTVTDNGVDVTSQLTQSSSDTETLVPSSNNNSNFTLSNIENAYDDADSADYAQLQLSAGGTTGTLYLNFPSFSLPSGATIQSVACRATLQYNRNGSSSGFTASCQMYSGSTAKGSATSVVSAGGTDVAKTTFNLSVGSWTASELANARFYLTATNSASGTARYLYVYGVSLEITYSIDGIIYIYTLTNVTADHTIVVSASASQPKLWFKDPSWTQAIKAWKKVSGTWVEQTDLTTIFQSGVNYRKGN